MTIGRALVHAADIAGVVGLSLPEAALTLALLLNVTKGSHFQPAVSMVLSSLAVAFSTSYVAVHSPCVFCNWVAVTHVRRYL